MRFLDRYDVGFRLPAVNDDRQVVLPRQGQMPGKVILLLGKRGIVPVAIEAGLAQRDHTLTRHEARHLVPGSRLCLGDVVRLDADSRINGGESSCQGNALGTGRSSRGDADHPGDAGRSSTLQHRGQIVAELFVIQMGVRVDQFVRHGQAR